jgi:uncharacterized protein (TIGR03067 family)
MRMLSVAVFCLLAFGLVWADQDVPAKMQGTWVAVEYDQNGARPGDDIAQKLRVTIQGDKLVIKPRVVAQYKPASAGEKKVEVVFTLEADKSDEVVFKLDQAKGRMDLLWKCARGETKTTKGLYQLEDDTLKICFAVADKNRPKKFPDGPKTGLVRMVLKRATP